MESPTPRAPRAAPDPPVLFANLVLIGVSLGSLAVLLLAVRRLLVDGDSAMRAYALVAAAGLVLPLLGLRLTAEWRARLALVLASVLATLYGAELLLAAVFSAPTSMTEAEAARLEYARAHGLPFDERTKYEVVMDLRERGTEAYPHIPTSIHVSRNGLPAEDGERLLPLAGVSGVTTVHCNESGEYTIYDSGPHGFGNPPEAFDGRAPDAVLVGDSFAEGACVAPEENVAGRLRREGHRVVKLGQGGVGPLLELAALTEYAIALRPRRIFWLYYEGNDLRDLRKEARAPLVRRYLENPYSAGLLRRQAEIDRVLRAYLERQIPRHLARGGRVERRSFLARIGRLQHLRARLKLLARPDLDLFTTVLTRADERARAAGSELVFVYLPEWRRYADALYGRLPHPRDEVLWTVERLGLPVIDFHESVAAHPDPLSLFPFRQAGHYNAEGYRLLAEQIGQAIP